MHPGVVVNHTGELTWEQHRTPDLDARAQWMKSPPRVELEHALIDVAVSKSDPLEAFRVFADGCQTRQTSAGAVATVLRGRSRVRGKPLLLELLGDLESGACSVLEREYLGQVERRHGLPEGRRQMRASSDGRSVYRDVEYEDFALIVEQGALTVRLTYGQVFGSACVTAARIGLLLNQRGVHLPATGSTALGRRCPPGRPGSPVRTGVPVRSSR